MSFRHDISQRRPHGRLFIGHVATHFMQVVSFPYGDDGDEYAGSDHTSASCERCEAVAWVRAEDTPELLPERWPAPPSRSDRVRPLARGGVLAPHKAALARGR